MTDSESLKATKNNFLDGLKNLTTCGKIFFIDKWSCANHVAFMNLYIFKGKEFHINGKLSIKVYQKPDNKYMYIPLYTLTLDIPLKIIYWVS